MRRTGRIALRRCLGLATIVSATPVQAIGPATIDQVVCAAHVVVEATVTATDRTCAKTDAATRCTGAANALLLDLRVARLLATKDTIDATHVAAEERRAGRPVDA